MRLYCAFICFVLSARIAAQHHYAPPVAEAEVPNGTDSAMPLIAPRMTPPDVIRLACHGRTPCNAIHRFVAGHDATGNSLEIFIIDLWDGTSEREGWGGALRPFKLLEDLQNCRAENAVEYWLFASKNRQIVKHQLIHVGCDGSGFGDLGEEGISFGDNGFSYHSHGGHGYNQGNSEAHGSLSPALILGSGWDAGPCDISGSDWDWRKFSGSGWRDPDGCGDGTGELRWSLIPRVSLPADYLSARWKTVSPGDCASREAFALKDDPPPNEQLLRVVLADSGDLFIEVHDDRLIDNPKRWIFGDHIELWLGSTHLEKDKDGHEERIDDSRQWGISAVTGKVVPGYGKPPPRHVMRHRVGRPAARDEVVYSEPSSRQRLALTRTSDVKKIQDYFWRY